MYKKISAEAGGALQKRVPMNSAPDTENVIPILILSLAAASLSFVVTESNLFLPFRKWARRKSRQLSKLMSCGYCFGHWTAVALVIIYKPRLLDAWMPLDFLLTVFIVAWLAGAQWAIMCLLLKKAGK